MKRKQGSPLTDNIPLRNLLILVTSFAILFGGTGIAFASPDIQATISSWFQKKQESSITEIDEAIEKEKEIQLEKLEQALTDAVANAQMELDAYTEQEKVKRTEALSQHADALIAGLKMMDDEQAASISNSLDAIMKEAVEKMEKVTEAPPTEEPADSLEGEG